MSKQPTIQCPVPGGHWTLAAHKVGVKYSATLELNGCEKVVCHAFANEAPEIDDDFLVLDNAHIRLIDQDTIGRVDQFLVDTESYANGAAV